MAVHAQRFARYNRTERSCRALTRRDMTGHTGYFIIQVALMIKQRFLFGFGGRRWIFGVAVALNAGFIIFNIVAVSTNIHRWEVAIIGGNAKWNRGVASDTLNPLVRHVQGMGKNWI